MKLRFTPRAVQDLAELAEYIKVRNPAAAQRVRAAIYESLRNLILFPRIGRRQATKGTRKMVIRKYPYLIYYTLDETTDEIIVLNFKHAARERDQDEIT